MTRQIKESVPKTDSRQNQLDWQYTLQTHSASYLAKASMLAVTSHIVIHNAEVRNINCHA